MLRNFLLVVVCFFTLASAQADTLRFHAGWTLECSVLQSSQDKVTVIYGSGLLTFERATIAEIKSSESKTDTTVAMTRVPSWKKAVSILALTPWAKNVEQIAATVIDEGVFKNVPYKSHQCDGNVEMNVYGDPSDPVAFEIGLYAPANADKEAKARCVELVSELLATDADKAGLKKLGIEKGLVVVEGLTIEVTPPDAPDAYGGWWISVYFEDKVNGIRASEAELKAITMAKTDAARERKLAEARRKVREEDAAKKKTAGKPSADEAEADVQSVGTSLRESPRATQSASRGSGSKASSGGGRVYVSGYFRKNGSYVSPHTRSSPKRK